MLTIKAEIKRGEQKVDGTYNVKLRFTLGRKVKRLSTSLFVKPEELTKTGQFKKSTKVYKEIEKLVIAYQEKCNAMQIDLNNYSLDHIFRLLKFDEQKEQRIDFIAFARKWINNATIKGAKNYETVVNSLVSFIGRDCLYITEITLSFLTRYSDFLDMKRNERVAKMREEGKHVPTGCSHFIWAASVISTKKPRSFTMTMTTTSCSYPLLLSIILKYPNKKPQENTHIALPDKIVNDYFIQVCYLFFYIQPTALPLLKTSLFLESIKQEYAFLHSPLLKYERATEKASSISPKFLLKWIYLQM